MCIFNIYVHVYQMLRPNPQTRATLDFILSDPYVVGAGGTVSRRVTYSKTFFDTVMEVSC